MILFFSAIPLAVFGGILGRIKTEQTLTTNKLPRKIKTVPTTPWYFNNWVLIALSGAILFSTLQLELSYVFESFWNKGAGIRYPAILTTLISLASISCKCLR